jgi:signal transduction histidine kinase
MFNAPHPAIALLFAFGLMVLVVLPLLAWLLLHGHRDTKAHLWFAGTGFYAFTAVLFSLQYQVPAWLAFDVGTTSTVVFFFLMHEAMRREISQAPARWGAMFTLTLSFGALYGYVDYVGLRPTLGFFIHSVTFSVLAFFNLRMALRLQKHFQSRACWVMAFAFCLSLGINSTRALMIVFTGDTVPLLTFSALSNAFLMSIFLGTICYSFGYWGFMLEKNRDQMVKLNSRFAAVSSLAVFNTAIVHEISQPLQAVQLCLNNLRPAAQSTQELETGLDRAMSLVRKLGHTVSALRNLMASQQERPSQVNVSELLQEFLPIVQVECNRNQVQFEQRLLSQPVGVQLDKILLERVVLNLVANALDALKHVRPSWPRLVLHTYLQDIAGKPHWCLRVQDNGPGIAPELLSSIAQPLQTNKEDGVGVGLALANVMLRQWQGELHARNLSPQEGGGAEVEIRIPVART